MVYLTDHHTEILSFCLPTSVMQGVSMSHIILQERKYIASPWLQFISMSLDMSVKITSRKSCWLGGGWVGDGSGGVGGGGVGMLSHLIHHTGLEVRGPGEVRRHKTILCQYSRKDHPVCNNFLGHHWPFLSSLKEMEMA